MSRRNHFAKYILRPYKPCTKLDGTQHKTNQHISSYRNIFIQFSSFTLHTLKLIPDCTKEWLFTSYSLLIFHFFRNDLHHFNETGYSINLLTLNNSDFEVWFAQYIWRGVMSSKFLMMYFFCGVHFFFKFANHSFFTALFWRIFPETGYWNLSTHCPVVKLQALFRQFVKPTTNTCAAIDVRYFG